MDDQTPSASTPVFKIKTKSRQRSNRPYERPSQSWGGTIVNSVSSISDWLKTAASYLTNTQAEGEIDVNEQSVLSNSSSRSAIYNEMPSEIRDASIRPSLCVLREEEGETDNEPRAEVSVANASKAAVPTAASTPCPSARDPQSSEEQPRALGPVASSTSESVSFPAPVSRDTSTRLSMSIGAMNRLDIPQDNLKRLKSNLSKRNRHSMPCSNISTSPPSKASRHETVDSNSTRIARNSDIFGLNSTLSSSFSFGPRSPFYDGRTSFGGSSSRRMSRLALPYSMGARKAAPILKVRPSEVAKSDYGRGEALSGASLKILDVINKESSLLEDTKKIPLNDSSGLSNKAVFNNFVNSTRRVSSSKPTTRLSLPSHITTSLLNRSMNPLHQNESTNNSNLDWRLNPTTFADDAHTPAATAVAAGASASSIADQQLQQQKRTFNVETSAPREKAGGKMKTQLSSPGLSNRSSSKLTSKDESIPVVNLPDVSIPLKSLPSFNLDCNKTSDPSTNDLYQFKFSWPSSHLEPTRDSHQVTTATAGAFTFSNPSSDVSDNTPTKVSINSTAFAPNTSSKSSPVISDATWSCSKCIFKNDPQVNQCLACKTPKDVCNSTKSSFQASVKQPATVPLASSSSSPLSPSTPSLPHQPAPPAPSSSSASSFASSAPSTITASSWGEKFKKPPGTWTCDVCMVDNKPQVNQCAACESPRVAASNPPPSFSGFKFNLSDKEPAPFKFSLSSTAVTAAPNSAAPAAASTPVSEVAKSDFGRSEALSSASPKTFDVINKEPSSLQDKGQSLFKFTLSSTAVTAAPTLAAAATPATTAATPASEVAKSDYGRGEALSGTSLKILDVTSKESPPLEDAKKIPLNDSSGLGNKAVFNNFVNPTTSVSSSEPTTRSSMPPLITTSILNRPISSFHQNESTNNSNSDWRLKPATFADGAQTPAAVAAATAVNNSTQPPSVPTTTVKPSGFDFSSTNLPMAFNFGNSQVATDSAPKFGAPVVASNGSFGSSSAVAGSSFNFTLAAAGATGSAPKFGGSVVASNGSFGGSSGVTGSPFPFSAAAAAAARAADSGPKFGAQVVSSNGSFGGSSGVSAVPFTFSAATAGANGVVSSGENKASPASRVVRKARRRLPTGK